MSNVKASAVVSLRIEIELGSRWGGNCTCDQIVKQSHEDALKIVRDLLEGKAVIVGSPKTTIRIHETDCDDSVVRVSK